MLTRYTRMQTLLPSHANTAAMLILLVGLLPPVRSSVYCAGVMPQAVEELFGEVDVTTILSRS